MKRSVRKLWISVVWKTNNLFSKIHPDPIFLLGNQKTGSTAIAALLAESSNEPIILDIFFRLFYPAERLLLEKKLPFKQFVRNNKLFFSYRLIKEPGLSFWVDEIINTFPLSKIVFILRDPRDNIRSILNRLNLRGDLTDLSIDQHQALPGDIWKMIVDGTLYDTKGGNYIESQALRWNKILQIYEKHANKMILIRYEDFVKDKANQIYQLAEKLCIEHPVDISDKVNFQYQSKGNRSISWEDFFGKENLWRIENICGEYMQKYGYQNS
jgi:hypothetical protein